MSQRGVGDALLNHPTTGTERQRTTHPIAEQRRTHPLPRGEPTVDHLPRRGPGQQLIRAGSTSPWPGCHATTPTAGPATRHRCCGSTHRASAENEAAPAPRWHLAAPAYPPAADPGCGASAHAPAAVAPTPPSACGHPRRTKLRQAETLTKRTPRISHRPRSSPQRLGHTPPQLRQTPPRRPRHPHPRHTQLRKTKPAARDRHPRRTRQPRQRTRRQRRPQPQRHPRQLTQTRTELHRVI